MSKQFILKGKINAMGVWVALCPNCEHVLNNLDNDISFCPYCGKKIAEEISDVVVSDNIQIAYVKDGE